MASSSPSSSSSPPTIIEDLDWEEWDSSGGLSFTHHCLAGSFAGVAEHTLLYPLDTVKTCWQSQVLHRVTGGATGCDPCSVHQTVNKLSAAENTTAATAARAMQQQQQQSQQSSSSSNVARSAAQQNSQQQQQQSIWSTMKHLMRHGSHHHHHHNHHHYQTPSHAHVYTLASKAPNVVDLTTGNNSTTKNNTSALNSNNNIVKKEKNLDKTTKRPWSKSARVIRGATLQDIVPVLQPSLYGTASTTSTNNFSISNSSVGGSGGATSTTNTAGFKRLWRGVQTIIVWGSGSGSVGDGGVTRGGNAGGTKEGMVRMGGGGGGEGWRGLYRSFPITVMTNVPYGMIMMTTNEWLRGVLEDGMYGFHEHHGDEKPFHFATILFSGMGAGMVASAVTAPLDRVKTRLQTQRMGMMVPSVVEGGVGGGGGGGAIMEERALAAAMGERKVCPKMAVQDVKSALFPSSSTASSAAGGTTMNHPRPPLPPPPSLSSLASHSQVSSPFTTKTYYTTPIEAFQSIIQEEGIRGLFRGTLPRVALHAPSVAISWTAYEMAKGWLIWLQ
ncbi:hypothetical protein ACHAWC_006904 [Mediolabrus comicus]